jgi:hypothetical protein
MEIKIPQTKNEAFAQLDEMLSEEDKRELAKSDAIKYHFSEKSRGQVLDF